RRWVPSVTSRATRAAMVQVLPVPALASSTVVPPGMGAVISNRSGTSAPPFGRQEALPEPERVLAQAAGHARVPGLVEVGAHLLGEQVLDGQLRAPDEPVVGIFVLAGEGRLEGAFPLLLRGGPLLRGRGPGIGVGGRPGVARLDRKRHWVR